MKKYILFILGVAVAFASFAQTPVITWPLDQVDSDSHFENLNKTITAVLTKSDGSTPVPSFTTDSSPVGVGALKLKPGEYLPIPDFFGAFLTPSQIPEEATITFWMKYEKDGSRKSIFYGDKDGNSYLGLSIKGNSLILSRKESYRDASSEFPIVETQNILNESGWYFVAISYHKYFLKLWVGKSGQHQMACSYQWLPTFNQGWSSISSFGLGSKGGLGSSIDAIGDFKVYDTALKKEEVHNLFTDDVQQSRLYIYLNGDMLDEPIVNAMVGDTITFKVHSEVSSAPTITNLPKTWIARFAGDLRYYVDASHKPGAKRPWIGFDTQVHWLNLRNYEQEDRSNYSSWTTNSPAPGSAAPTSNDHSYELVYVVESPMKAAVNLPVKYEWPKFSQHKDANGQFDLNKVLLQGEEKNLRGEAWKQRANQKEGLNTQILHYWNSDNKQWSPEGTYKNYSKLSYMLGFDDDEILYLNNPEYSDPTKVNGSYAILKEPMRWQIVPTNEGASINDCVNEMVTAYYRHNSVYNADERFVGSEIQDYNTHWDFETNTGNPFGTGTWLHENGNVKITLSDETTFQVAINAESPLKNFYAIEGTSVPGRNEVLTYKLKAYGDNTDLYEIISDYKARGFDLTMEYETQDSFGSVKRECNCPDQNNCGWTSASGKRTGLCTHQRYSTNSNSDLNTKGTNPFAILSSGTNELEFDFKAYTDAYCSITLYLVNPQNGDRIILAGKEVSPVNLAFIEDQNLSKGTGEGGYFFVEQQRRVATTPTTKQVNGPFNVTRGARYVNPFVRTYTFYSDQSSNWQVIDSDPSLLGGGHDWYLSNKKQATRISDSEISSDCLVKFYFDLIPETDLDGYLEKTELGAPICPGLSRNYQIDYSTVSPGTYQLTAIYRDGPPMRHKVIVKSERTTSTDPMASINAYHVPAYDSALLKHAGMQFVPDEKHYVLELQELSSKLMFLIGERNNYKNNLTGIPNTIDPASEKLKKVNRWGPYNDFEGKFYWRSGTADGFISSIDNFIFDDSSEDWKLTVSDQLTNQDVVDKNYGGVEALHFPDLWGNHFSSLWKKEGPSGNAGPIYLPTSGLPNDPNHSNLSSDIGNYFASNVSDPHYWQFRTTLNSWSDSYGYRMRYNPSHLYDLNKLFDDTHGAFTGNAVSMQYSNKNSKSTQPYPSDNYLNLQAWHYDLKMGRKVIVTEDTYDHIKNSIRVYNDFNVEYSKLNSPGGYATQNKILFEHIKESFDDTTPNKHTIQICSDCDVVSKSTPSARILVQESILDPEQELLPGLSVYPVPAEQDLTVEINTLNLSPLYMSIYDLQGKRVLEYSGYVEAGNNRFLLERSQLNLSSGMYVLKVTTQELAESRNIVFK